MDLNNLRGLVEAFEQVYAPQEVDEAVKGESSERRKDLAAERKAGHRPLPAKEGEKYASHKLSQMAYAKRRRMGEDVDIFDTVLEFLQAEGFAETLEEAEWIMANELDAEDIEEILEAEGSYGQTPKARQAMGKLAIARREKPASEYSQKGEKTKKVKSIEKHTRRIDNGPDAGNRGKKSTKPRYSGMLGKSGRGKLDQDSRDHARDSAVEYTAGGHKPGSGTVTKNPKKLRKQKAMGEHD
jgi:hypothetical protein